MLNSAFSRTRYVSRKREILKYLFMPVRDGLWSFYRRPHANKVAAARNKNNPRSYSFFFLPFTRNSENHSSPRGTTAEAGMSELLIHRIRRRRLSKIFHEMEIYSSFNLPPPKKNHYNFSIGNWSDSIVAR